MKPVVFQVLDTLLHVLLLRLLFCGVDLATNWCSSTHFDGYAAPPVAKVLGFSLILLGLWNDQR